MKKIFFLFLGIIIVPLVITFKYFNYEKKISDISEKKLNKQKKITIRVKKSDLSIEKMDIEEYLVGVVSAEVPVSFEKEAIKAQAVAARTYALKQMENSKERNYDVTDDTNTQVYYSLDTLKNNWKDKYDENLSKIKECIYETNREYLTYDDQIIYAFFFSTSNGKTEDNKDVFGQDLPYLKVVDSSFDMEENKKSIMTKTFSKQEFYTKLGINYSDILTLEEIKYTDSNRVKSLKVNGTSFSGRDFQKKLSLRSNDFEISESDNITIKTKGFGHGVGMSQYGANSLAKQNKKYDEILKYYYQGTNLKKL